MENKNLRKLVLAAMFCAVAIVGSTFSFPVLGSRCAPIQHVINVFCAVWLGPTYGVLVAFGASLLRNLMGLGSLLAFPGSMFGAFLSAIIFQRTKQLLPTCLGECFGTGIIGALVAYPVAILFMGKVGHIGYFAYVVPFLISTVGGSIIGGIIAYYVRKAQKSNQLL